MIKNKKGFTLVEMIVVVVIIGIISAIAVPSLIGFVNSGNNIKRNNIARTIYLAAQNSLTTMRINGKLGDLVTFDGKGEEEKATIKNPAVKKIPIDISTSDSDTDNKEYMYYLTIEKSNYEADGKTLYDLLKTYTVDPVDGDDSKSIFKNSICVEFNARTGVVKSAFYSEKLDVKWTYDGSETSSDNLIKRDLSSLDKKRQGFYGVATTGSVPPDAIDLKLFLRDGSTEPLVLSGVTNQEYKNILYVEAFVPRDSKRDYTIELLNKDGESFSIDADKYPIIVSRIKPSNKNNIPTSINNMEFTGILNSSIGKDLTFLIQGSGSDSLYTRIIWIIDIVNSKDQKMDNSLGWREQFKNSPQMISAVLTESDSNRVIQSNKKHSHYAAEQGSGIFNSGNVYYHITDTRHLSNVRYKHDGMFLQQNDINVSDYKNEKISFAPLSTKKSAGNISKLEKYSFIGKYYGTDKDNKNTQYQIINLDISTPIDESIQYIGLFGEVGDGGVIQGVSLNKATINSGRANVGSLVGKLSKGGKVIQCNSYANVTNTGEKAKNTGGLIGIIDEGGILEQSYNGGYDNAPIDTGKTITGKTTSDKTGNVFADRGNIGGLVGLNNGKVTNCYNNARVNINEVLVDNKLLSHSPTYYPLAGSAIANIGGVVGENGSKGTVQYTYATNYTATYKGSKSGGIVGMRDTHNGTIKDNFYITNGNFDPTSTTKKSLKKIDNSAFKDGIGYPDTPPETTTSTTYPYPTLKTNIHITNWEDIKEVYTDKANFLYYEMYNDGSIKYSDGSSTDSLIKKGDKYKDDQGDLVEKLVVNDGYCLEFSYATKYDLIIGSNSYSIEDTNGDSTDPEWVCKSVPPSATSFAHKPIKFEVEETIADEKIIKTRYRLFFENSILEPLGNGDNSTKIQLNIQDVQMLEGSSNLDASTAIPETFVYFNPLFANAILKNQGENVNPILLKIRSPRNLDNVDKDLSSRPTFTQELNVDFDIYRKELSIKDDKPILKTGTDKMTFTTAVVKDQFEGTYDGNNCYIKNVEAHIGLFDMIANGATVKNLALLKSTFKGNSNVGSIAGENDGTIEICEVSDVIVEATGSNVGGIVGINNSVVRNVYFNSTNRGETGVYATPISGNSNVGGLIGVNSGTFENAFTTAVGPNINPTIGSGKEVEAKDKIYYLTATGYNAVESDTGQGTALKPDAVEWKSIFSGNDKWEIATNADTTVETFMCRDMIFPFPKLKDINHFYDWPILVPTLQYYEKYSDSSFGYYYYINKDKPVDSLKYNPNLTVVEEGYLIDLITDGRYSVRLGEVETNIDELKIETMNKRRVMKIPHDKAENLTTDKVTKDGIMPIKIRASSAISENFVNELYGEDTEGFVYFNPLFAKEIHLTKSTNGTAENPIIDKEFEIRSPRQMLNININEHSRNYSYTQSISLNFALEEVDGRKNYIKDDKALTKVNKNVISDFTGNYTGKYKDKTSRIYNLVMYVEDKTAVTTSPAAADAYTKYTGSTFGNNTGNISHLEFVNAQIRFNVFIKYAPNGENAHSWTYAVGNGGGIVVNKNHGTIDNVKVYNTKPQSLFADINGGVGKDNIITGFEPNGKPIYTEGTGAFCLSPSPAEGGSGHFHGGIAAQNIGPEAKISNCIVGTKSGDISQIQQNNTMIVCHPREGRTITRIGGIVGFMYENAEVIACTNISTINVLFNVPNLSDSSCAVGGIAGAIGLRVLDHKTSPVHIDWNYYKSITKTEYEKLLNDTSRVLTPSPGFVIGSYNAGSIRVNEGFIGGIVGHISRNSIITSCYNTGRINISGSGGELVQQVKSSALIRVGGLGGEVEADIIFRNCYNIGYISGEVKLEPANRTGAGTLFGLVKNNSPKSENCYSLLAKQFRASEVSGIYLGSSSINGFKVSTKEIEKSLDLSPLDKNASKEEREERNLIVGEEMAKILNAKLQGAVSQTRNQLRNPDSASTVEGVAVSAKELTSSKYMGTFPGLSYTVGSDKGYPVLQFINDSSMPYIYPQIGTFTYKEKEYSNPHITAWEYIDSQYETTLKYYEKYKGQDGKDENSYGYYYLDMFGNPQSTLKANAGVVVDDGYILELKEAGELQVKIGDQTFVATSKKVEGKYNDKIVIEFTDEMKKALTTGYTKISVFSKGTDDDTMNRVLGTTDARDLYFNYYLPMEIRYTDKLDEKSEYYAIRSPRHLDGIGKIALATGSLTKEKTFKQELNIDFETYEKGKVSTDLSVVQGEFNGTYDGDNKTISNIKLTGKDASGIGLFEKNNGTIKNLKLDNCEYTGGSSSTGIVASQNLSGGKIENVAVIQPKLNNGKIMGSIAGTNTGSIKNVYVVSKDDTFTGLNKDDTVGGLVGNNTGKITSSLYLAKAPTYTVDKDKTVYPITGSNSDAKNISNDVYYLAGKDYNDYDNANTGGIPLTTVKMKLLEFNIEVWEFIKDGAYPYPSLIGITPPTEYPTVDNEVEYKLAYYEKYGDNEYGLYSSDSDTTLLADKKILESGYGIVVPRGETYTIRIDKEDGVKLDSIEIESGKFLEIVEKNTNEKDNVDLKLKKVTLNNFEMLNGYAYYYPLFAKSVYNKEDAVSMFAIRTPEQMLNVNKVITSGVTFTQDLDIDFDGKTFNKSIISAIFSGTYNGNSHNISNFIIDAPNEDNIGLFSQNSGSINGVNLKYPVYIKGNNYVGGIAGTGNTISNCSVTNIRVVAVGDNIGGICGNPIMDTSDESTKAFIDFLKDIKAANKLYDDSISSSDYTNVAKSIYKAKIIEAEKVLIATLQYDNIALVKSALDLATEEFKSSKILKIEVTPCDNLTITVPPTATKGILVNIILTHNPAYMCTVIVNDSNGVSVTATPGQDNRSYSFVMPETAVTISATMQANTNLNLVAKIDEATIYNANITGDNGIGNYPSSLKTAYETSINNAKTILSNMFATETEVQNAIATLKTEKTNLEISKIYAINTTQSNNATVNISVEQGTAPTYLQGSSDRAIYNNNVTVNVNVLDGYTFESISVNGQISNTTFTMPNNSVDITVNVKANKVDTTALAAAIDAANKLIISGEYSQEGIDVYTDAINAANLVLSQEVVTADDINNALAALATAISVLETYKLFTITIISDLGATVSVTTDGAPITKAIAGSTVNLAVVVNDGYTLSSVVLDNSVLSGSNFVMPSSPVTIQVTTTAIVPPEIVPDETVPDETVPDETVPDEIDSDTIVPTQILALPPEIELLPKP